MVLTSEVNFHWTFDFVSWLCGICFLSCDLKCWFVHSSWQPVSLSLWLCLSPPFLPDSFVTLFSFPRPQSRTTSDMDDLVPLLGRVIRESQVRSLSQWCGAHIYLFSNFLFLKMILFIWWGEGAEGEGDCPLNREPDSRYHPRTPRSRPKQKADT